MMNTEPTDLSGWSILLTVAITVAQLIAYLLSATGNLAWTILTGLFLLAAMFVSPRGNYWQVIAQSAIIHRVLVLSFPALVFLIVDQLKLAERAVVAVSAGAGAVFVVTLTYHIHSASRNGKNDNRRS